MILEDLSFTEAFYFTVVTISTVGYGDINPSTVAGRVLAIVLIVVGVGTFLAVLANATQALLERRQERARKQRINMLIGVFFSEIGTRLLHFFSSFDNFSGSSSSGRSIRNHPIGY